MRIPKVLLIAFLATVAAAQSNPLEQIESLERIVMVMRNGVIFSKSL